MNNGWLAGLVWLALAATTAAETHHDMAGMVSTDNPDMAHAQPPIGIPDGVPIPRLTLWAHRDDMSGINLHLDLWDYALASPEYAEVPDRLNGHAHLYVNGEKIQRLYGPDVHLPAKVFKPGVNVIVVSLNAHSHAVWQKGETPLMASVFVDLDRDQPVLHRFSTLESKDD